MKLVRLSALRTGRLYTPGNIPGTHFCWRLSRPQGHIAAGRFMSIKNSNDTIGNRTRVLPACSAVHQTTAPLCTPCSQSYTKLNAYTASYNEHAVYEHHVYDHTVQDEQLFTNTLYVTSILYIGTLYIISITEYEHPLYMSTMYIMNILYITSILYMGPLYITNTLYIMSILFMTTVYIMSTLYINNLYMRILNSALCI